MKDSLNAMANILKHYWEVEEKRRYQQVLLHWKNLNDTGFWDVMEKCLTAVFCSE